MCSSDHIRSGLMCATCLFIEYEHTVLTRDAAINLRGDPHDFCLTVMVAQSCVEDALGFVIHSRKDGITTAAVFY